MRELEPSVAADLAFNVYSVNGEDEFSLKTFMSTKIFSRGNEKSIIKGEVGGRVFRAAKDGFGFFAKGSGDYANDVFLIFRGTTKANNSADFITDARIGLTRSQTGLPVHIGFNHTFNSMLADISRFIAAANVTGTIHCLGHSLGGAVASLAADWVARNGAHAVKLYTFGAPRVGTEWFVKRTTTAIGFENIHRVYHRTDPVPMVALYPFMQAPYGHQAHYLHSSQPLATGEAHLMKTYIGSVAEKTWTELQAVRDQPYDVEVALESWLRSKSPVDASSASFWRWVDSALIYVIKKISMAAVIHLQGSLIGLHTVADKIAYILAKGIDLSGSISVWVEHLMRKLMQALNMKVANHKNELTTQLIRQVLVRIQNKAAKDARNAVQKTESQ
jgi:triacylglycerol lipase